jgi:hypothetical protein
MISAAEALQTGAIALLQEVDGLTGVYPGPPLHASVPCAEAECGPESDWGHKSAGGREVRLAVRLRDSGELPTRIQGLMAAAESALRIPPETGEWQLVSFVWLRSRLVREGRGPDASWTGLIEYRARMLEPVAV